MKTIDNQKQQTQKPLISWRLNHIHQRLVVPWLFLLPAVIGFFFFVWYPIGKSFILSFQVVQLGQPDQFVGFGNYRRLFGSETFWIAWKNTIYYTLLALLLGYLVPVILAITMNEIKQLRAFFRLSIYIPAMVPLVVGVLIWQYIYSPSPAGLLNTVLGYLNIGPFLWYNDPQLAMPAIVLIATWLGMGSTALIYLAALQSVPPDLYEAAEIDGAGIMQRMMYITVPQLLPIMFITLILQILGTLKVFVEPFILTGGGPTNATLTVMLDMYNYAFTYVQFGVASAYGVILFLVLLVLTIIYFRLTSRFQY